MMKKAAVTAKKFRDYDKRIYRLLYILNRMDNRRRVMSPALAKEFHVSLRTVQRDLELLSMTGFPLMSDQKGVHTFAEGFSLKKMMVSAEEASLLSLLYELVQSLGARNFEKSFRGLLKKMMTDGAGSAFYVKLPRRAGGVERFSFFQSLEKAVTENRKIIIHYSAARQKASDAHYTLCPLKIVYFDGFWYLLSLLDGKNWLLKFRMDRIIDVKTLPDYFHAPGNLKTILNESANIWFSEKKAQRVVLEIDKSAADYFRQNQYFPYQKILRTGQKEALILESAVSDFMEVVPTILRWIPWIRVRSPKALKVEINARLKSFLQKH